ncbi:MAG: LPS assembly protein LptD [Opitutaceae bacterium]
MIRRFFVTLAILLFTFRGSAAEIQPVVDGGDATYVGKEILITGGAQVSFGNARITSDELRYNTETGVADARGHVTFTRGSRRLLADTMIYRARDETFSAENVRFGDYPVFGSAAAASGTKTEITLDRARLSYREPGPWQPTVNAGKIIYGPGDRVRAESAQAGVGGAQPFPFPKFQQRVSEPLIPFVTFSAGFRSSLGAFGEAGVRVPVSPAVRLGGDIAYYTKRGLMAGPSAEYGNARANGSYHGLFRSGFINDHGDKLFDVLGRPVGENRGYAEWEHQQRIGENLTFNGQLNYWKDSAILRDFRPGAFINVQEPDTFLESVYTGKNYFVSAFTRFQPNSFQVVQQRLPEIRFDLLPLAVGHGFYEQFNASAVHLREDAPLGGPYLQSDRVDAYYALMRPFTPRDWFSFTPVAGGRVTYYANTRGMTAAGLPVVQGGTTRLLGELGFDAMLRTSGKFDYQNAFWKINGLRHLLTPKLSYRSIPGADRRQDRIPAIDRRQAFSTYLPPLDLGATRNIDQLEPMNVLRFGIDNTLQTRDPVYGSRDLLLVNVAADYEFDPKPGQRNFSAVHGEMALMPAHWLQFDLYGSYTTQTAVLRELNSGLTLRDGDVWSVRFANNFLRDDIEDYLVEGRMRINEIFEAQTKLHYDARKRRFNEQAYGIAQNIDNIWRISYVVTFYSGRQRESDFGFSVRFEALRF